MIKPPVPAAASETPRPASDQVLDALQALLQVFQIIREAGKVGSHRLRQSGQSGERRSRVAAAQNSFQGHLGSQGADVGLAGDGGFGAGACEQERRGSHRQRAAGGVGDPDQGGLRSKALQQLHDFGAGPGLGDCHDQCVRGEQGGRMVDQLGSFEHEDRQTLPEQRQVEWVQAVEGGAHAGQNDPPQLPGTQLSGKAGKWSKIHSGKGRQRILQGLRLVQDVVDVRNFE